MPDSSRNPEDNIKLSRLEQELAATSAAMRKQGIAIERGKTEGIAETKLSAERTAARTEAAARSAAGRGVTDPGRGAPESLPKRAAAVEQNIGAEQRLKSAIRQRIEAERQARLPVPYNRGGGGVAREGAGFTMGRDPAALTAARQRAEAMAAEERRIYMATARGLPAAGAMQVPPGGFGGGRQPPTGGKATAAGGADEGGQSRFSRSMRQATAEVSDHAAEIDRLDERYRKLHAGAFNASNALEYEARAHALAADSTAKHGYLTSEFIDQALRGQVTFRQFGDNILGTIGKFAGWTAAATAVYGVLGALGALGRGALDAESGVGKVSRIITTGLDTSKLKQQFRDLSATYNLPIGDVVDAVYGSAKVFNDQADAVKAAESALFAVKVGELDAAKATQYLTAIVNGFKLQAKDLPNVFDAINQAQNKFGGNTGQLVAGVAKAGGAFKLAGGNYKELIALIETGVKLTGSTGENVGTAISRSASRILTPQGAEALRSAGITPGQSYIDTLRQAFQQSEGAAPEKVNEIARALVPSGGQFARIFAPILQNQQTFDKVLKEIRTNSKGSAQRELGTALGQPDEQIKALVNNVQRLGSAFAQAGGLNGLGVVVATLNEALTLTTKLVEQISHIPGIKVAAPFLELAAVFKLLRRLDVGSSLPTGSGKNPAYDNFRQSLRRGPNQLYDATVHRDFDEAGTLLRGEAQKARGEAVRTRLKQLHAETAEKAVPRRATLGPGIDPVAAEAAHLERRQLAETAHIDAVKASATASAKAAAIEAEIVALELKRNEYDRLRKSGLEAGLAAERAGIAYTTGTLARGRPATGQRPQTTGGGAADAALGSRGLAAQRAYEEEGRRAGLSRAARYRDNARSFVDRVDDRFRGASQTGSTTIRGTERNLGAAGRAIGTVGTTAITATRGLFGLTGSLRKFAAEANTSLGALDKLLIGLFAANTVYNTVKGGVKDASDAITRQDRGNLADVQKNAAFKERSFGSNLPVVGSHGLFGSFSGLFNNVTTQIARDLKPFGLKTSTLIQEDRAKSAKAELEKIRNAQVGGVSLTQGQISSRVKQGIAGAKSPAEQIQAIQKAIQEETVSLGNLRGTRKDQGIVAGNIASFKARIASIKAEMGDLSAMDEALRDDKSIGEFADRFRTRIKDRGAGGNAGAVTAALIKARIRDIAKNPDHLAKQLQEIQADQQALLDAAQAQLDRALAVSHDPGARASARAQFSAAAAQAYVSGPQQALEQADKQLQKAQDQLANTLNIPFAGTKSKRNRAEQGVITAGRQREEAAARLQEGQAKLAALQAQQQEENFQEAQNQADAQSSVAVAKTHGNAVAGTKAKLAGQRSKLAAIAQQYGSDSAEYLNAYAEAINLQDQLVSDQIGAIESKAAVVASAQSDPIAATRVQLDAINRELQILARRHRQNSDQYRQLLVSRNEQQKQLIQAELSRFQTHQEVASSGANIGASDEAKLARGVSDAAAYLKKVSSTKGVDPETIAQAQIAYNNARGAVADQMKQQAEDLLAAQTELALSRTEDPIKRARIEYDAAIKALQRAKTPGDRLRARADVNNKRRDLRQTIQKTQYDSINLDLDLELIDRETAISRLEALLKRTKGNKDLKDQIRRQLHQLRKDASSQNDGLDLDLGNIKIPTLYEIRRAAKGRDQGVNIQNRNATTVIVRREADVAHVARVLHENNTGLNRAGARAMGVR